MIWVCQINLHLIHFRLISCKLLCFTALTGYLNNAKATAESITPDGWFHSGDTGYYDEEGHFFIVDRLKELIKYKGFQVNVFEVNIAVRLM